MMAESFETMLTGGHPNSLGRTIEVVEIILANPARMDDLYRCYQSEDEVVRLRTSNAIKRIWRQSPDLVLPYVDRMLTEVHAIDQASAQWTTAQMISELNNYMSDKQRQTAIHVLKANLEKSNDWIVVIGGILVLPVSIAFITEVHDGIRCGG